VGAWRAGLCLTATALAACAGEARPPPGGAGGEGGTGVAIDALLWTQQAEITASDGAEWDLLGASVSVSGDTAVVGAPGRGAGPTPGQGPGAVYVFVQSGAAWVQQAEITAGDGAPGDAFGASVSVSGAAAVVGAPAHGVGSNPGAGAAYVFVKSGATWALQAEITAGDGASGDAFGTSVSLSGNAAVVGAPAHGGAGAAYVIVQSGGAWAQQAELTAGDGVAGDAFGASVSVSGGTAVVGAPSRGAAYVFAQGGATWAQQAEITAGDGAMGDDFGASVSVSGGTAIVGAPGHDAGTGAAYVFTQAGATWTEQAELTASDAAAGDAFGCSVSVSGDAAIVGADRHEAGADTFAGAAYVFLASGAAWPEQAELTASDGVAGDELGVSVSMRGDTAIVGAYHHPIGTTFHAGAAYVFDFCAIDGAAYAAGVMNPANACQICAPSTSTTAWSDAICTAFDACHAPGTCDPTSGLCDNPTKPDGSACTGGTCEGGVCTGPGTGGGGSTGTSSSTTGTASSSGGGGGSTGTAGAGCACAAAPSPPPYGLVALGGLLALGWRRRARAACRG
jgi:MYXO-CTERM domain-containing protein